jgi:hypothetical protein
VRFAWKFGLIALIALALTVLPGGGGALSVVLVFLTLAFFTAIAFLGFRLYRQFHFELESLEDRQRLALYASIGGALLTFSAADRMFGAGGFGVLAWLALLGLCSYGLYWVWTRYRTYS